MSTTLPQCREGGGRTEHSVAAKSGGCFPGGAMVTLEDGGQRAMQDLQPSERVLVSTGSDGSGDLVYSEVLTFLDRDPLTWKQFYMIRTEEGVSLSLTAAHLLFVSDGNCTRGTVPPPGALRTIFASDAQPGQCMMTAKTQEGEKHSAARLSRITQVVVREDRGAYAPLTRQGTLVVDGAVVSCYAVVDHQTLAHWAFYPLRLLHRWTGTTGHHGDGLHWYSQILYWLGTLILDSEQFHPWGMDEPGR